MRKQVVARTEAHEQDPPEPATGAGEDAQLVVVEPPRDNRKRKLPPHRKDVRYRGNNNSSTTTVSSKIRDIMTSLISNNSNEHEADPHKFTLFVQSSSMTELVSDYISRENVRLSDSTRLSHRATAISSFIEAYDTYVDAMPHLSLHPDQNRDTLP